MMKRNLLIEICFDGGAYRGWQMQSTQITVQSTISEVLYRLFDKHPIVLHGSSRTDAGVHAIGMAASFITPETPRIPTEKIFIALNNMLPRNIKIKSISEQPADFHARFNALGKAYCYVFNRGEESPFTTRYAWCAPGTLDLERMNETAQIFVGKHDFSSFAVCRSKIDDATRTIYRMEVREFGDYLCVLCIGDGFLYKMVRSIIGALHLAAQGRLSVDDLHCILQCKDRSTAPETAPPHGLFLMKVFYDPESMERYQLTSLPFA